MNICLQNTLIYEGVYGRLEVLLLQNKLTSSLHHRAWQLVWAVCADVVCLAWPSTVLSVRGINLHFCLFCKKEIVPDVLQFVQMQLCKLMPRCHDLFKEDGLSPGKSLKQAVLVQSHSDCMPWTWTFRCEHVFCFFIFWDFSEHCKCESTPGKIPSCHECFHRVNNLPRCIMMKEMTLQPFPDWWIVSLRSLFMPFFLGIALIHSLTSQTWKLTKHLQIGELVEYIWLAGPGCYLPSKFRWKQKAFA